MAESTSRAQALRPRTRRVRVIELVIHGVGGSTVEDLLGRDRPHTPMTSDATDTTGYWASEHELKHPPARERRAYLWGDHSRVLLGLWLVLLPFTLVNVAG